VGVVTSFVRKPRLGKGPPDVATLVRRFLNEFQLVKNDCCNG
jgi:hypothetical protein